MLQLAVAGRKCLKLYMCLCQMWSMDIDIGQIYFPPPIFSSLSPIISNMLKLGQIWRFQYKNGTILRASRSFIVYFFAPTPPPGVPKKNFDAGAASDQVNLFL